MSDALGFDCVEPDDQPMRATLALADGLAKTLRITKALLQAGRDVDLAGLDRIIGLLCARALDLPPEHGRAVRPELITLRRELDTLIALLGERVGQTSREDTGPEDTGPEDTGPEDAAPDDTAPP